MSSERLIYLPLGGAGEIGMNAYVYGYGRPGKERLIVVDIGVAFPDMDWKRCTWPQPHCHMWTLPSRSV